MPTGLPELQLPTLSFEVLPRILQPAFILALLGSIDSLLTSLVADSITRDRHDSDRELIGQGIGNMAAGLIGGLPGAGATMRTVVNVRAGGRTPLSGALHALVLLALVLGPLAEHIPHAILLKVGWDIIDWGYLKRLKRAPRDKAFVMLVTLLLTVFVDLITAVAVGLILAGFITARWNAEEELKGIAHLASPDDAENHQLSEAEREALREAQGKVALVRLRGRFSYASARELVRRASTVDSDIAHGAVIYDFSDATRLDTSAALAVEELLIVAEEAGIACVICGLSGEAEQALRDLRVLDKIAPSRVLDDRRQAIALACELAGGRPQG